MSTLQAIVTALDEQLTLTDEEKSVVYSARLFDMEYQQRGTKHLYTVADLVLHAAAFHGSFRIMEGLFALNANLNLFLHGADLLNSVIARASRAGLLSWPDEEAVAGTEETIELIQLLVAHGVPAEEEHLKEAIKGKNLELVQYLITQVGLDVGVAVRTRVPGTEEIREWAKEWKKVNERKARLSSSLNKEERTKSTKNKV